MKKLALLALSVIATAAMAAGEIDITGTSIQIAAMRTSAVVNTAYGEDSVAQQNLASNVGDIDIRGTSVQVVAAHGSYVSNWANEDTLAQQNLSSNVGDVDIRGRSLQVTALYNSFVGNSAKGDDALAVQNIASNNSCFGCPKESGRED